MKVSAVTAVDAMFENKKSAAAAKVMFFTSSLSHQVSVRVSDEKYMPQLGAQDNYSNSKDNFEKSFSTQVFSLLSLPVVVASTEL